MIVKEASVIYIMFSSSEFVKESISQNQKEMIEYRSHKNINLAMTATHSDLGVK